MLPRNTKTNPTYRTWIQMKQRCYTKSQTSYPLYGGRGIRVCPRWHDYKNFLQDMGIKPDGMTLDRIDTNGDYHPANCRWASPQDQANNKRSNHYLTFDGKSQTITQWADEIGIQRETIKTRLKLGWPVDRILSTPIKTNMRNKNARKKDN